MRYRKIRFSENCAFKLQLSSSSEVDDKNCLIGYANADWAGSATDRKSTSGCLFQLYGSTISWKSRKQQCVSISSTEAEYVSLSEACQEGVWLKLLLKDFNIEQISKFVMYEDNQSCLKMLNSENVCNRTKHIDTRYHFAKELQEKGHTFFKYCPTEEMIADILTNLWKL